MNFIFLIFLVNPILYFSLAWINWLLKQFMYCFVNVVSFYMFRNFRSRFLEQFINVIIWVFFRWILNFTIKLILVGLVGPIFLFTIRLIVTLLSLVWPITISSIVITKVRTRILFWMWIFVITLIIFWFFTSYQNFQSLTYCWISLF